MKALRATLVVSCAVQYTALCSPGNAHMCLYKHAAQSAAHKDWLDKWPQDRLCFQAMPEMGSTFQIRSLLLYTVLYIAQARRQGSRRAIREWLMQSSPSCQTVHGCTVILMLTRKPGYHQMSL